MIKIEFNSKIQSGSVTLPEKESLLFLEGLKEHHKKYSRSDLYKAQPASDHLTVKTSKV